MHADRGILAERDYTRIARVVLLMDISGSWILILSMSILKKDLRKQKEGHGEREMRIVDLAGELSEYIAQDREMNKDSAS
jgi:hypothetical protein